eukprot:MONOS_5935.1-p1 / transcript=MONOS_5935.1 / gene=MONOS_5935 / organism=Monocercomonoides_exilis_PA203 / gene_product=unspecified product / transcript_product=unspecified product / location=Mono_scaffold00179:50288-53243(-) / protein_length=840 / sequence_SO=supercontig / SO=protein_coding / is_pseudo=false
MIVESRPLGKIYLAAKINRKLSRKLAIQTDIAKMARMIDDETDNQMHQESQLTSAMKMCGYLYFGLVRIYTRKLQIFSDDLLSFRTKMSITLQPPSISLPLHIRQKRKANNILPDNSLNMQLMDSNPFDIIGALNVMESSAFSLSDSLQDHQNSTSNEQDSLSSTPFSTFGKNFDRRHVFGEDLDNLGIGVTSEALIGFGSGFYSEDASFYSSQKEETPPNGELDNVRIFEEDEEEDTGIAYGNDDIGVEDNDTIDDLIEYGQDYDEGQPIVQERERVFERTKEISHLAQEKNVRLKIMKNPQGGGNVKHKRLTPLFQITDLVQQRKTPNFDGKPLKTPLVAAEVHRKSEEEMEEELAHLETKVAKKYKGQIIDDLTEIGGEEMRLIISSSAILSRKTPKPKKIIDISIDKSHNSTELGSEASSPTIGAKNEQNLIESEKIPSELESQRTVSSWSEFNKSQESVEIMQSPDASLPLFPKSFPLNTKIPTAEAVLAEAFRKVATRRTFRASLSDSEDSDNDLDMETWRRKNKEDEDSELGKSLTPSIRNEAEDNFSYTERAGLRSITSFSERISTALFSETENSLFSAHVRRIHTTTSPSILLTPSEFIYTSMLSPKKIEERDENNDPFIEMDDNDFSADLPAKQVELPRSPLSDSETITQNDHFEDAISEVSTNSSSSSEKMTASPISSAGSVNESGTRSEKGTQFSFSKLSNRMSEQHNREYIIKQSKVLDETAQAFWMHLHKVLQRRMPKTPSNTTSPATNRENEFGGAQQNDEKNRKRKKTDLTFTKLLKGCKRRTVALAFSSLLSLSAVGLVELKQEYPYQEIFISDSSSADKGSS